MLTYALVLLAVVGSATPVFAQGSETARSTTTGLMLGLGLNGSGIQFEDDKDSDSGIGGSLQFGYGFTRRFTGMIDVSAASLHGDPGEGKVSLASGAATAPGDCAHRRATHGVSGSEMGS
jgi:hypothetical protein